MGSFSILDGMNAATAANSAVQPGAGGVVFNREGRVLLVQYRDATWTFPKGHLEVGERPVDTALREVLEETGIAAQELDWLPPTSYTNNRGQRLSLIHI